MINDALTFAVAAGLAYLMGQLVGEPAMAALAAQIEEETLWRIACYIGW